MEAVSDAVFFSVCWAVLGFILGAAWAEGYYERHR